jgi:hypothetical protein
MAQQTEMAGAQRERSWSSSRTVTVALLAAVLLLEVIPLEGWLVTLAGYSSRNPTRTAAPLWFVVGSILAAWALQSTVRGRQTRPAPTAYLPLMLIELLLLLRVSPDIYGETPGGPFDLSWVGMIGPDLARANPHVGAALLLFLLLAYLTWRGASIAREPLQSIDAVSRLRNGMAVLIVAVVTAALVRDPAQPSVLGALAFLLPAEVFAGLMAAALSRAAAQRDRMGEQAADGGGYPWLRASIMLSVAVILLTLALSVLVNYQSVGALLAFLGPLGELISTVVFWVVNLVGEVLYFVFNGIVSFIHTQTSHSPYTPPQNLNTCSAAFVRCTPHQSTLPPFWRHLAILLLQALALATIVAAFLYVLRVAFPTQSRQAERTLDEEREALDGRSILAAQLRGLFARRPDEGRELDTLPKGSVRYLYRAVLQAMASVAFPRSLSETPDEYAARLAQAGPLATSPGDEAADFQVLSEAYDAARYANREPEAAQRQALRQQAGSILRRLGARSDRV